ncbi:hypothetical protein CMI42_05925 [Candidatus Pacearchaeota archaeon]|nr:hypothetical protein [Candidatus Pacearchaeota archaeon]
MKLIVIYGPPAIGKLSVANELSKITGYKIFHNHLTNDLIETILEFGTEAFFDFNDKLRLELLEKAAKEKVRGVIFTFCYGNPMDDKWVRELIKRIKKHNSKIYFVQLFTEKSILYKRVKNISRKEFGKIRSIKKLKESLSKWELLTPIPFVDNLTINNSKLSPRKVAQQIKSHYKLK